MKLSFVDLCELDAKLAPLTDAEREEALFYTEQAEDMAADEICAEISHGCLLFREFSSDTGYYFEYPLPLSDGADIAAALGDIAEYCLSESIPEVIVGIPEEDLPSVTEGLTHPYLQQFEDGSYLLRVETECSLLDELPESMVADIYIGEFASRYAKDYARLVEDRELNKYYGYDMTADIKASRPEDYIVAVREEFSRGESMCFAATVSGDDGENIFVGEGTLSRFDGRGGADAAFRVLPEHQGRHYGRMILEALAEVAEGLGLKRLSLAVMTDNAPSLATLAPYGEPTVRGSVAYYELKIPFNYIYRR